MISTRTTIENVCINCISFTFTRTFSKQIRNYIRLNGVQVMF